MQDPSSDIAETGEGDETHQAGMESLGTGLCHISTDSLVEGKTCSVMFCGIKSLGPVLCGQPAMATRKANESRARR